MDSTSNPAGGTGEPQGEMEYHHKRGELKLIARAIRKRWIIPKDAEDVLPNEMYQIATTREVKVWMGDGENVKEVSMPNSRSQIAATKVLLDMEAQNREDDPDAPPVPVKATQTTTTTEYTIEFDRGG